MKGLYESILDTDVLDKANKGGNRLLDVMDMLHTLVDDLDIKQKPGSDDPTKVPHLTRLYFVFNHGMPKDSFKDIRSRLEKFKKDVKKQSGIEISIKTTNKRTSISTPIQRREYGLDPIFDNQRDYALDVNIDEKFIGTIYINVAQYSTDNKPHSCSISAFLGDFDKIVFTELLKQMDKNK